MKDNKHLFGRNKQQDIYNIIEEIKSFKGMLPNSVREIEIANSNHSIDERNIFSLIKEFAIYGIK
jgi:SOS-response transcriptional repressor LexA